MNNLHIDFALEYYFMETFPWVLEAYGKHVGISIVTEEKWNANMPAFTFPRPKYLSNDWRQIIGYSITTVDIIARNIPFFIRSLSNQTE